MRFQFLLAACAAGLTVPSVAMAQHDHHPAPPPSTPAPTPDRHEGHEHPAQAPLSAAEPHVQHAPVDHSMHEIGAMRMGDSTGAWASGTALLPAAGNMMTGAMFDTGGWAFMAHGHVWGAYTDQSGPRGDGMAFIQNMAMLTADRDLSDTVHLQLRAMGSVEPLMGRRGYPNLLATGETAFGVPLVDRQHPHDLFMELAGRVDVSLGDERSLFVYGGPVGEPAIGPAAFMHRRSARYRVIPLSELAAASDGRAVETGVFATFQSLPGREAALSASLSKPRPHVQCWPRNAIPARFHYGSNPRIPAWFCLAESGWRITDRAVERAGGGEHGYDNADPAMRALFIAHGPAFTAGRKLADFDNIDVAPLLRRLIGLPSKSGLDGSDAAFESVVRR